MDEKLIHDLYYFGFFAIPIAYYMESFVFPKTWIKSVIKTISFFIYLAIGIAFSII